MGIIHKNYWFIFLPKYIKEHVMYLNLFLKFKLIKNVFALIFLVSRAKFTIT